MTPLLAASRLLPEPAGAEAERRGWPLAGAAHSTSQG